MRILVTGASGYIGTHIVKQLLDMGHNVIACDIRNSGVDSRALYMDTNIFGTELNLYEEFGCPDICIHLAWKDGFSHNSYAHMEMLSKHYTFIKSMLESGLRHIVVMGSMHEIGYYEGAIDENTPTNPLSYYGIAKNSLRKSVELLCKEYHAVYQWIRAFYIMGDDLKNNSIFSKIETMEMKGEKSFPFVSGKNKYDFIDIKELSYQISLTSVQEDVNGIINCCSGKPVAIADMVEAFIENNHFNIKPDFGKFPEREYDSPAIWGNNDKIKQILLNYEKRIKINE